MDLLYSHGKKPIKIVGISSGKRSIEDCAREDPVSLFYLKLALKEAEKHGAKTQLIDLRHLKINPCKECYSTCPAQCRFNEKTFQCDCYRFKQKLLLVKKETLATPEIAYDMFSKTYFIKLLEDDSKIEPRDDMWIVYKALMEADGVIFATATNFYDRPALFQTMFSRFCSLDGGVEKLWGDGKNLKNSIKYAKRKGVKYKQRLYNKWCAFINCSKEGDLVSPNLMKACTMIGMKTIPLGVAYRVNWYNNPTFRSDTLNSKKDKYSVSLSKYIGKEIVNQIKNSQRKYGKYSEVV